jgi:putative two-component system response regulator
MRGAAGGKIGISREKSAMVELAAQLHDIGKIGIADAILLKPGKLTPEEYAQMRKHCEYACHCLPHTPPKNMYRAHCREGKNSRDSWRRQRIRSRR